MAIDSNGLKLLMWAKSLGATYERTLTLGRQGLNVAPGDVRRTAKECGLEISAEQIDLCFKREPMSGIYAENLLGVLGAEEVISVDLSPFEGANCIHDLNEQFPASMRNAFDMVFDGGTLEHVFDYPGALRNCMELVRVGGFFVTIAPANSFMGHGFYQISPELFFRVFSEQNGFQATKVLIYAASKKNASFYEVTDPAIFGDRVELANSEPMYLALIAKRTSEKPCLLSPPQQSDYAAIWKSHEEQVSSQPARGGKLWELRVRLNPHWPQWLRSFRAFFFRLIRPRTNKISNASFYRRVRPEEFKGK